MTFTTISFLRISLRLANLLLPHTLYVRYASYMPTSLNAHSHGTDDEYIGLQSCLWHAVNVLVHNSYFDDGAQVQLDFKIWQAGYR